MEPEIIDRLYFDLAESITEEDQTILVEKCGQYPDLASDLAIFAYLRSYEVETEDKLDILSASNGRAEAVAVKARMAWSAVPDSLIETARTRDITVEGLARLLRLGVAFVAKLERRLFAPSSIPQPLIVSLSNALSLSRDAVSQYLRMPPTPALGAAHRSRSGLSVPKQSSFTDAVQQDESLSQDDAAYWREVLS